MGLVNLLQTTQIPVDSVDVKAQLNAVAEKIATTPKDVLFQEFLDKALAFGLKVIAALVIYMVGAWLIKKITRMIQRHFDRKQTDATIASFVKSLVSIGMTVFLIIITISTLGINTTSIAALLAAGGMAIGMALSGTVQNFAGGIMLLVFKPFKAGDYIEAQGFAGTVSEVNIVSTRLTTPDNKNIIIPNGALSNGTINNYSHNKMRRVDWLVEVEYGSSSDETKKLLFSLIQDDARILGSTTEIKAADPFVGLSLLGSNGVQFVMRAWVRTEDYWDVFFEINEKIYNELPKHGISFPFNQMDVRIRN